MKNLIPSGIRLASAALLLSTLFLTSLSFAQTNYCEFPGQIFNREYLGIRGDKVFKEFKRSGNASIPTTSEFKGTIESTLNHVFKETYCMPTTEQYTENVCQPVELNTALGNGNQTFKNFYNLSISALKRAEYFSTTVKYLLNEPTSSRLDHAHKVISVLAQSASTLGIPHSFEELTFVLNKAVKDGLLFQTLVDEITTMHAEQNKLSLGFIPMRDVTITEGRGNGILQKFTSLQETVQIRANFIRKALLNVDAPLSMALATNFIQFASQSGAPRNWNEFTLMMNYAVQSKVLSPELHFEIMKNNEEFTRTNLGFQREANLCKLVTKTRKVNVVSIRNVDEFLKVVSKSFEISLIEGALLNNENETFSVLFDGQNPLTVNSSKTYNTYTLENYTESQPGFIKFLLKGKRIPVTPTNTVKTEILRNGNINAVQFINTNFNPLIGGKMVVTLNYYEVIPIFTDKFLGSDTVEILNGAMIEKKVPYLLQKPKRKLRVDVSMQIIGSPYFSSDKSAIIENSK